MSPSAFMCIHTYIHTKVQAWFPIFTTALFSLYHRGTPEMGHSPKSFKHVPLK